MAGFLVKDVDAYSNDDLNDEEDQCTQPVPHDGRVLLTARATRFGTSILSKLRATGRSRERGQTQA